jgi:hypothetical protein
LIVTGTVEELLEPPAAPLPPLPPAAEPPPLAEPLELCATELTAVIFPSTTVLPVGISTVTFSPTFASLCLAASRSTVTISCVEFVCKIAEALPPLLDAELLDDFDEDELLFDELE